MRNLLFSATCLALVGCAAPTGPSKPPAAATRPAPSMANRYNHLSEKQLAARTRTRVEGEATR